MDPKSLKTPKLERTYTLAATTSNTLTALKVSREQRAFDAACVKEATAINEIAASGNLALMLALEYQLQLDDLTNYAKTETEIKNTRLGLKDFIAGMTNYERLVAKPKEYRQQAAGYPSGSRDKQLDVPMDGLRSVINSQLTRIQQRQSLMVSDATKALHTARRNLLAAIRKEYSLLQQAVVHGDKTTQKVANAR